VTNPRETLALSKGLAGADGLATVTTIAGALSGGGGGTTRAVETVPDTGGGTDETRGDATPTAVFTDLAPGFGAKVAAAPLPFSAGESGTIDGSISDVLGLAEGTTCPILGSAPGAENA
jgi:hypothetical protein